MNPGHDILVVDDDARLRKLLSQYLSDHGYHVVTAEDARQAGEYMDFLRFDGIVLDVMMPGETGFSLAARLKKSGKSPPILLLTAMAEAENRITGLETGADDYLTKPFEPRELLLRLQNIVKRGAAGGGGLQYRLGAFTYDPEKNQLERGGKTFALSTAESTLLKVLAGHRGDAVSRESLMERCQLDGNERTVDVQITRLRKKIEEDPAHPKVLQTVRGKGYVLYADIL